MDAPLAIGVSMLKRPKSSLSAFNRRISALSGGIDGLDGTARVAANGLDQACPPPCTRPCGALAAEYEPHADRGMDHLVAERGTRQVVKAVAGAMRGDQIIRIDLAEFLDGRADVVVAERRHHVEAADHGQHLVDAGGRDRLAHGVDDAAMAARS